MGYLNLKVPPRKIPIEYKGRKEELYSGEAWQKPP